MGSAKDESRPLVTVALRSVGVALGVVVPLVLVAGWFELRHMEDERTRLEHDLGQRISSVAKTEDVRRLSSANSGLTMALLVTSDPEKRATLFSQRARNRELISGLLANLGDEAVTREERRALGDVAVAREPYLASMTEATVRTPDEGGSPVNPELLVEEVQRRLDTYNAALEHHLRLKTIELAGSLVETGHELEARRRAILFVTALAALATLGLALTSGLALTRELRRREASDRTLRENIAALELSLVEAQAAAAANSQFLASMSHEIRTPLNAVIGMAEVLADMPLAPEQRGYTDSIRVGGEILLGLVSDLLDFSKLEAGKQQLESVEFALDALLEDSAQLLAPKARAAGLELSVVIEPGTPTAVRGDPRQIGRVITNFLGNALKFTAVGEISLRARGVRETSTGAVVRIEVQDSGIGIPPDVQARLFQDFTQADASITRRFGGTGLGLAISRKISDLLGGSIGVVSQEGRGSTFWLELPLERRPVPVPASEPLLSSMPRTLLVDLSGRALLMVPEQLRALGVAFDRVVGASLALTALQREAAAGHPYGLVILDAVRFEASELALPHALRGDPLLAGAKLLGLASLDEPFEADSPLDSLLMKPVRRSVLGEVLGRLAEQTPRPQSVSEVRARPQPVAAPAVPCVLVVDDVAVNRAVAVALLERLGCRSEAAVNGAAAVEAVQRSHFDLVLMDCQMPEVDGHEATARIRALAGPVRDIPIVAMTANALTGDLEKCLAAGMNDYLVKPLTLEVVRASLLRWLPSHRAAGEGSLTQRSGDANSIH